MILFHLLDTILALTLIIPETESPLSLPPPLLFPPNPQILQIRYKFDNDSRWFKPGAKIPNKEAKVAPQVSSSGLDLDCSKLYLIFLIDLDVILNNTIATTILHWYQPNLAVNCSEGDMKGLLTPRKDTNPGLHVASYIAPRARGQVHHRYAFFLFEQPPKFFFPRCFAHIFPETVDARAGFDLIQFGNVTGLELLVGTNWFCGGDLATTTPTVTGTTLTTSMRVAPCEMTRSTYSMDMTGNQTVLE